MTYAYPCKECRNHTPTCHGSCKDYADAVDRVREKQRPQKQKAEQRQLSAEMIRDSFDRRRRRRHYK